MHDQINLFDNDILRDYDLQSSSDKHANGKLITYCFLIRRLNLLPNNRRRSSYMFKHKKHLEVNIKHEDLSGYHDTLFVKKKGKK